MNKGRVIEAHRTNFSVAVEDKNKVVTATVRGSFHIEGDFPKVGDYVSLTFLGDEQAVIEDVLPRTSVIKRRAPETEEEQILVANADLILIVMGLDGDFNLSRLERYLLLAKLSEVQAVVVLNKADLVEDPQSYLDQVKTVSGNVAVELVSAKTGESLANLSHYITPVTTAVLLGSSGAGKSTITNWLLSEDKQVVKDIRQSDSRGRHTTTSRQLFVLPQGGFLIDTPGMRELGMVESEAEQEQAIFERIENFAQQCQFNNCDHEKSTGCAVLQAVEAGALTERELKNYHKLILEQARIANKHSSAGQRYQAEYKQRKKQQSIAIRKNKKT